MRKAKVYLVERLSHMHNEAPGTRKIIQVRTDLREGDMNTFYIEPVDSNGIPLIIEREELPNGLIAMTFGDEIEFDVQNGFQKCVRWNGRQFRQRGYSYDFYAPLR